MRETIEPVSVVPVVDYDIPLPVCCCYGGPRLKAIRTGTRLGRVKRRNRSFSDIIEIGPIRVDHHQWVG